VQKGRRATVAAGTVGKLGGFQPGGQDVADGPVSRISGLDRLRAGGFEPGGTVLLAQREDRLGRAQLVVGGAVEQTTDDLAGGRADLGSGLAAPGGSAPVERDLLLSYLESAVPGQLRYGLAGN
jgi:hypothetical protein